MPALQPPDMQIGGLPPGYGPLPPSGPPLAQAYQYAAPRLIQSVFGFTTGAAQPTSASLTIAASGAGNLLVALIGGMAQGGTQNIPVATGFTNVNGTQGNSVGTIACNICLLANNAGGITTVTWPTLTNWSSAVMGVFEFSGVSTAPSIAVAGQSLSTSATSQGAFAANTPALGSLIFVGILFCNSTQVAGNNSKPVGAWTGSAVQTSTNSQASVVNTSGIIEFLIETAAGLQGIQPAVSVGVATACGAAGAGIATLASSSAGDASDHGIMVDNGTTAGFGGAGNSGWSLGGTKPGGAGGGQ